VARRDPPDLQIPTYRFDKDFRIFNILLKGDRVAVRWKWQGTHKGPFGGFQASQKQLTNEGMAIFQIKDHKIVRVWLQTDRLGFLQEIGAVPKDLGAGPQSKENK
jgi:predicted ester cyclase